MSLLYRIRCKLIDALGGRSEIYVDGVAEDHYNKGIADATHPAEAMRHFFEGAEWAQDNPNFTTRQLNMAALEYSKQVKETE